MLQPTADGALSRYIEIRRELIEDLEFMASILQQDQKASEEGTLVESIVEKVSHRLEQLREDRLTIGVFGETCSGKSTLINALSRREVTRPDVVSNTGVIMEFEYAKEEKLTLHFLDGRSVPTTWEEIPTYTDQMHNPENEKGIARVHIALPLDYLKYGMRFYDTPGLNDVVREYSQLSRHWLDNMGAVIITSLYPPFTRSEIDFLKRATHQCSKLFIVINLSQDYWAQRERLRDQVLRNIRRDPDLQNHPDLAADKIRIYVINARVAWEATRAEQMEQLESSGFLPFKRDLEAFLAQDSSRVVLASSIRNSFEVITLLQKLLTMRSQVLFAEREVVEKKLTELQETNQKAELKKYELFDAIDGEMQGLLELVHPQVAAMVNHTTEQLRAIQERKAYAAMLEDVESLYRRNMEEAAAIEKVITERIDAIFQAAQRWLSRQLDELLQINEPELGKDVESFSFSHAQRLMLGIFSGYEDRLGMAEAVVGVTTVSASMAASGQGMAVLAPILGPLAFPVGGVGGFVVGMFARNFMKARTLRQHIASQILQIEESRELLSDKLHVVLVRVAENIKDWVSNYFTQIFANITSIVEEHHQKLQEDGYLAKQREHLELRQQQLDQVRDRFLVRLEEIQELLDFDAAL